MELATLDDLLGQCEVTVIPVELLKLNKMVYVKPLVATDLRRVFGVEKPEEFERFVKLDPETREIVCTAYAVCDADGNSLVNSIDQALQFCNMDLACYNAIHNAAVFKRGITEKDIEEAEKNSQATQS